MVSLYPAWHGACRLKKALRVTKSSGAPWRRAEQAAGGRAAAADAATIAGVYYYSWDEAAVCALEFGWIRSKA